MVDQPHLTFLAGVAVGTALMAIIVRLMKWNQRRTAIGLAVFGGAMFVSLLAWYLATA